MSFKSWLRGLLLGLAWGCLGLGCVHHQPPDWRPGFRIVRPPVAFEILRDNPEILIVDLRTEEEFHGPLGHLKAALNIPLADLEDRLDALVPVVRTGFLVYCRDDECGLAGMRTLGTHGFRYAFLLEGGIDAWLAHGYRTTAPPPGD
jgi:rhodanese-related sulfurtransferase